MEFFFSHHVVEGSDKDNLHKIVELPFQASNFNQFYFSKDKEKKRNHILHSKCQPQHLVSITKVASQVTSLHNEAKTLEPKENFGFKICYDIFCFPSFFNISISKFFKCS